MNRKLMVANWKMNPATPREAKALALKLKALAAKAPHALVVCVPSIFLGSLTSQKSGKLIWGAQDVSVEAGSGPFTGETSAAQVRYAGAVYAIIGHSERRARGETGETINQKVKNSLAAKLKPIICVGETERDEKGDYLEPLQKQIKEALAGLKKNDLKNVVIAYEPVWAVGSQAKRADTPENFLHHAIFVRKVISDLFDKKTAMAVPILYGGSVDSRNAFGFLTAGEADGLLVGRASLKPEEFKKIIYAQSN